jgi:malonyl-CoA/methylmalonyl-CoA synthetase
VILDALLRAPGGSIVDQRGEISLHEVLDRASRVASTLRGRRIAVMAEPSRDFVVGVLAVMWSGASAVVLSPLHPPAEIAAACRRAGVEHVLSTLSESAPCALPDPTSDALLLFTSGTTAAPKGVRLTHHNLWAHARVLHEAWQWSPDDHLIHALPLHHLHGLGTALFTALAAGARVELLPRFDPELVIHAIGERSVWMAVPTMIARMVPSPALLRLRLVTNGSAGLPRVLSDRFAEMAGARPVERFGMTETGVVTTQSLLHREPGNCGRAVPGMDVRIVDDEIQVRGDGVFPGYDGEPPIEGWFATGDSGALNANGELFVHGRISVDVLKSGGYKLSALEIEGAIREHPLVDEVAVVGIPDVEWGDRVTAAIVARAGLDVAELRAFLRDRLAPYKVPKDFVLCSELPRNSIGKVVKPALISRIAGAAKA